MFAQLDSESEELLKCGVKLFWVQQELAILTVSYHIGYVYRYCSIVCVHGTVKFPGAYSSLKIVFEEPSTHVHTAPCNTLVLSFSLSSFSGFIPLGINETHPEGSAKKKNIKK